MLFRVKVVAPREYNPRYELDFNSKADYDPDRQRSEARKLQRQMVKEKRGAMRELRRDAAFMAAVSMSNNNGAAPPPGLAAENSTLVAASAAALMQQAPCSYCVSCSDAFDGGGAMPKT